MNNSALNQIRTPYKHNALVLLPSYQPGSFDSHAVDCPFLFSHGGQYGMTFVGWDGTGYRSGLALSDDLVHWRKEAILLDRGPQGSPTEFNAALTCILRDNDLYGTGALKPIGGWFVGTYHAYPRPGYESGPAVIGLCFSQDLYHWEVGDPLLYPDPNCAWESGGLYKSWILEHEGTFYLFYNAKNHSEGGWIEQTGVAMSTDLARWERYPGNPILKVGPAGAFDDYFASDPCVLREQVAGLGERWVMFYFGNSSDGHARDSAAFSTDLLHWEKAGEVLVDVGPARQHQLALRAQSRDNSRNGVLYHFYCAVSPAVPGQTGLTGHNEVRGISFAASQRQSPEPA